MEIYLGNILFVYFFKYCVIESLSCTMNLNHFYSVLLKFILLFKTKSIFRYFLISQDVESFFYSAHTRRFISPGKICSICFNTFGTVDDSNPFTARLTSNLSCWDHTSQTMCDPLSI